MDDIATKYIIPGETSDGAVMFLPAEAVFAEIHARHRDLVDYAQNKCVWITSPTTLMAVLTTALSVIRNVETRQQAHIIKKELGKLGVDIVGDTPQEFHAYIKSEIPKWTAIVKASGAKLD